MTQADWLTAVEPSHLLHHLRTIGRLTDRKLRLFQAACCRRIWRLLTDPRSRHAVETSERFADQLATAGEVAEASHAASMAAAEAQARHEEAVAAAGLVNDVTRAAFAPTTAASAALADAASAASSCTIMDGQDGRSSAYINAAYAAASGDAAAHPDRYSDPYTAQRTYLEARDTEYASQVELLREMFGDMSQPVAIDPRWLTSDVLALADAIYSNAAFERLPILGDALLDAGCNEDLILSHCRGATSHVLGCWLIDLLLHDGC